MDLTEAEGIRKIWQEYTEELYKKDLSDPEYHDGVITHLEPDILECEVKWALESITTKKGSGGDGISAELFQILKDDTVKMLHSINMPANLENSTVATALKKVFSFQYQRKAMHFKAMHTIALISYARNVMLKIFQAILQQYVNQELADVQIGFRKGKGTTNQIANIPWITEKAREFQNNI